MSGVFFITCVTAERWIGADSLALPWRVKRKHENRRVHVHTHALAQFLGAGSAGSRKVRNSEPPLQLMLTPRLRKHVRNFSWLITGSRDPLSLSHHALFSTNRFKSHDMSKSSWPVSDLNCVYLHESTSQDLSINWHMYWAMGRNCKKKKIEAESMGDTVSHLFVKQHSRFDSWRCQEQRKERAREWRSRAAEESWFTVQSALRKLVCTRVVSGERWLMLS